MRDEVALLLILWGLYLFELSIWLPHKSILLSFGVRRSVGFAGGFPGNDKGSFLLADLLPWRQHSVMASQPPVVFTAKGVYLGYCQHWSDIPKRRSKFSHIGYGEITSVEREGTKLILNGAVNIDCYRQAAALDYLHLVEKLKSLDPSERIGEIKAHMSARFPKCEEVENRFLKIKHVTRYHRWFSSALFVYGFALCPVVYWFYPSPILLLGILISCLVFGWGLSATYFFTHKRLYPDEADARFHSMLHQVFCFPVAVGAGKLLTLRAFEGVDPLVVAKCASTSEGFRRFAKTVWLDLNHPIPTENESDYREILEVQRELTQDFLKESGLTVEDLERPLSAWEVETRCYCPRCHSQFITEREFCSECPGVRTKRVEETIR